MTRKSSSEKSKLNVNKIMISISIVIVINFLYVCLMYYTNSYPLGNDVYGHLFKINELYKSVLDGNWYPLYERHWYNGIEMFKYWPPMSYYLCTILMIATYGDIYKAFVLFVCLCAIVQGIGVATIGIWKRKYLLATILGSIFFILPDNLRVSFGEGNIPRMFITALIPWIFLCIAIYLEDNKFYPLVILWILLMLVVFAHFMIAAMLGVSIFLYVTIYAMANKSFWRSVNVLIVSIMSYLCCAAVLIPGLTGGIVTQDSSASQSTSGNMWSSTLISSLNAFNRFDFQNEGNQIFYFGISLFIILVIGVILSNKKTVSGFLSAGIILIGTTTVVLPILSTLPMSQVFWMIRFIPIAEVMILISFIEWEHLKKRWITVFLILLSVDSIASVYSFIGVMQPTKDAKESTIIESNLLDDAIAMTDSRFAYMDLSSIGSFPSYYITSDRKDVNYLFGWAYQGASTIHEVVLLNEAFECGYYDYMFDRLLEYGCDTVLFRRDLIEKESKLITCAEDIGYSIVAKNDESILFKYDIDTTFGTIVDWKYVAIGDGSEYISLLFPQFKKLYDNTLDNYSFNDLKMYEKIYISGAKINNQAYCADLLTKLDENGTHVYIDMANLPQNKNTGKKSINGVDAQEMIFKKGVPIIKLDNGSEYALQHESSDWRTYYITNVPRKLKGYHYVGGGEFTYLGESFSGNIKYISFNVIYNKILNKQWEQPLLVKYLEEVFDCTAFCLPSRDVVPLIIEYKSDGIFIASDFDNVNTSLSRLNCMKSPQNIGMDTFVIANKGFTNIRFTDDEYAIPVLLSIIFVIGQILILICGKIIDINHQMCAIMEEKKKISQEIYKRYLYTPEELDIYIEPDWAVLSGNCTDEEEKNVEKNN